MAIIYNTSFSCFPCLWNQLTVKQDQTIKSKTLSFCFISVGKVSFVFKYPLYIYNSDVFLLCQEEIR